MLRCLLLNYPWDGQNSLAYYIQRTGYLTIEQAGALTDELLERLQTNSYDLVFLHLSTIDEVIPNSFLHALSQHGRLVVTSPFPRHLYAAYELNPVAYLTEPYSYERFLKCIEMLLQKNS